MTKPTENLWRQFHEALRTYIFKKVPHREDAEDLLQEAYLRFHQKPPARTTSLRGWVFTVVRNLINDFYRSGPGPAELANDAIADEDRFEVRESEQILSAWLRTTVEELPPKYALAVKMADLEGRSMAFIAKRLGLSISGAKSRVQRGRHLLTNVVLECCTFHLDKQGRVADWTRNEPCACNVSEGNTANRARGKQGSICG